MMGRLFYPPLAASVAVVQRRASEEKRDTMTRNVLLITVAALAVLAQSGRDLAAQTGDGSPQWKFQGTINDYIDPGSPVGAWHLTGHWSVHIKGPSGKATFTASIAMIRPGSGASPHTHHVLLDDATVTTTATGWIVQGEPAMTSNGALAFAGSTVTVELTGEAALLPSNVKFSFQGPAAGHFTSAAIDGVVAVN